MHGILKKISIRWPNVCVRIGEGEGGSQETYSVRLKKISEIYGRPLIPIFSFDQPIVTSDIPVCHFAC